MTEDEIDAFALANAKEQLTDINRKLWELRMAHNDRVGMEKARHEDRLRDIEEQFFYEREPFEKQRDAIVRLLADAEILKGPKPIIVV